MPHQASGLARVADASRILNCIVGSSRRKTRLLMATVNVAGLVQSGWVRNVHVAFAVLVVYEHLLQMKNEVELFWTSRCLDTSAWCLMWEMPSSFCGKIPLLHVSSYLRRGQIY
ncbi:hypothetical protein L208DRAFT_59477 [Tricholoma matsutake]|nr:hypothetical protein L208DRAFT_59477 [Tricholoma matsutake 945]